MMLTSAAGTDLNIIGLTEMGDFCNGRSSYISASQSSIIYIVDRKFTTVGVIFYHTIFVLHGFDFRTCLQVHTAVLCAQ